LGVTMSLPLEDKYTARKNELLARLVVIMGGRVAEEIIFGDVTSGASGDIKQATGLARKMVCEWGMSQDLGMVGYTDNEDYVFLGRDLGRPRGYSEATAQEIDREVKQLIDNAYARATELLTNHRDKLEIIAKALLEFETLTGAQIEDIASTGQMSDPPKPKAPTPSEPQQPQVKLPEKLRPLPPELPPGLAGAPA
jgi:cell division protease FtsH